MGYSVQILNNIRMDASEEYQELIPEATRNNISEVGNALLTYKLQYNEFCTNLIHKIGKTIVESKLFKNKLARFKSGVVLSQQDVEEIFVDMAQNCVTNYDPNGSNPLGRREEDNVRVAYHRMNRKSCYEFTIGDLDFLRAFKSEATLDTFISGLINSVYSRAAYDEWILMKDLLATYKHPTINRSYFKYGVPALDGTNNELACKAFVKTLRKAVQDLSFPMNLYNIGEVTTWTNPEDLVLLINKDLIAEIDVEVLAKAFNMGKTDIQTQIVVMDDFGSLENTYALLIDKDFFKVFDTLSDMESQRNAQGKFTNYFYHVHQILSLSPFKNAVRFTTEEVE